ncbi:TonB-dependent receptor [Flavobacterium sp. CBA20B-1]|uniref:TonB-dependent receptor n=1 Tax=unclassified Flavobacterium TaxID=196869 RepID=UPI00222436E2|nr:MULTISPECIES: TonB-dependent receptor [unclassified Flavobacterium]WCM42008.1 TonB-dependent receptor [Flavobacterium sp. CBA20B-1]
MKKTLLLVSFLMSVAAFSQTKHTISGTIFQKSTSQPIPISNVSFLVNNIETSTTTNENGDYSIIAESGTYQISVYVDGYGYSTQKVNLKKDTKINFYVAPDTEALDEIVINATNKINIRKPEMSVNKLTAAEIKKAPVVLGETDILKTILLLPGVVNSGEGTSGFNVRGGGSDQNLLLLDQTSVYGSSHLYGFFSVFNNDAVSNIKLYKGGIPARYGGRASSVLEINQKSGDFEDFKTTGGIGILSSRLLVEGPVIKDKLSYLFAGRASYAHLFLKLTDIESAAYFYDLNTKWSYLLNDKNQFYFTGYFGRDIFKFNDNFDNKFGNTVANLTWNSVLSNKINSEASVRYSDYYYGLMLNFVGFNWDSGIKNFEFNYKFNHNINQKLSLKYGINSLYYDFNPGLIEPTSIDSEINRYQIPHKFAWENAVFLEAEHDINTFLSINYGLRYSMFNRLGEESINVYENNNPVVYNQQTDTYEKAVPIGTQFYGKNKVISTFDNLEPRLAVSVKLTEDQSVKMSYNRMSQYVHLISNTTAATPLDIWEPSGPYIKPQIVDQYAVGYFQNFKENEYSLEIESYFKLGKNRLDYIDGADLIGNRAIEQVLLNGKTEAYGLEFLFRKNEGNLTGWVAYTIARSLQQTVGRTAEETGINNGEWYRTPHDRLQDLSVVANYEYSKKWSFNAAFVLQSGRPVTYPDGKYEFLGFQVPNYNKRNNYSMPAFHHLDISATYTPTKNENRKWQSEWIFGIYNVYNRKNAASISFRTVEGSNNLTETTKLSIFGIVPSVTYNFKF